MARRVYLPLLALLLSPLTAAAQEGGERRIIPVSVIDREGKLVEGLTAADFRGELRGKPVTPISLRLNAGRRHIALVIDTTGSMGRDPAAWDLVWASAQLAVERLTPAHLLGASTIGDDLQVISSLTSDPRALESALRKARHAGPRGKAGLADAILQLVDDWPLRFGDSIVFITDGMDAVSRATDKHVSQSVSRGQVRVFTVCIDPRRFSRLRFGDAPELGICDWLPSNTGGRNAKFVTISSNLESELARLSAFYDSLLVFYALEVQLPSGVDKPREWKLEVVDGTGKKRKDVEIAYPRLLVPLESKAPVK